LTGGNRNDVTQLIPLIEDLHRRPVAGKRGRPRQKPDRLLADRGYDHDKHRRLLRALGITPVIARRGTANGSGLGRQRWVVERGFAHLHNFRRLRIRYERDPDMHTAFLTLACSILLATPTVHFERPSKRGTVNHRAGELVLITATGLDPPLGLTAHE
jgi:transposase